MGENLLVILGPTASGKTALSLAAAAALDGEIISGDSVQVYRGMDIGSAKLPEAERVFAGKKIIHHMIDIRRPDEDFTAADFASAAKDLIAEISKRGRLPILVGGTGFYLESVYGRNMFESLPPRNREFCEKLKALPPEELHSRLLAIDPAAAEKIHAHDIVRMVRALDIFYNHGMTPSEVIMQTAKLPQTQYHIYKCGMEFPREELYQRIDARVDAMLEQGLEAEVKELAAQGFGLHNKAMQAIGYRQMHEYLNGSIDFAEAVRLIKRDSRHFAKRQLTWFRRDNEIIWYKSDDFADFDALINKAIGDMKLFFGR